jgi:hypothetical protein
LHINFVAAKANSGEEFHQHQIGHTTEPRMTTRPVRRVKARLMDSDTFSGIVWGVVLFAILLWFYLSHLRHRRRTKRLLIIELLKRYFEGDIPVDQIGQRTRAIANRHFIKSPEFYSIAIAGFQHAVDAKLANRSHSEEHKKKMLSLLAVLKKEFGLTDLYRVEAWRSGRE